MNRHKILEGQKTKRMPAAEVGQIWQWKHPKTETPMLLHKPYEEGFHCIHLNGHGNISFNRMADFYDKYEYVKDASPEEIVKIEADHEAFSKGEAVDKLVAFAEAIQRNKGAIQ